MATVTIVDPVSRIEGHMKVKVTIDTVNGRQQVTDAQCTGTQFRGFETMLKGRAPKDASYLTQRICGVCPVSHGMAANLALEQAAVVTAPTNGRLMRNLVLASNFLQSHILHFYLLTALDYVNGPDSAPWTPVWNVDLMRDSRLQQISNNFTTAVTMRRKAHEMGAIFGGRLPSPPSFQAGGITTKPTSTNIGLFRNYLNEMLQFIQYTYLPDVDLLASVYSDYKQIGKGHGNLMAYGVFDTVDSGSTKFLKRGLVYNSAPGTVQALSTANIKEMVTYSWYDNATNNLNPAAGNTVTVDPATKAAAYSWMKAPRYSNAPFEMGPLARMWVNGDYRSGVSVMDRHQARAREALKVATAMQDWLAQIAVGGAVINNLTVPVSKTGVGLTEAPRGGLGHWLNISSTGKIANYQIITPTCWNASPKDTNGVRGPLEQALIGTPVTNATQPVEVLRVIHSFDPCLSCAVHVIRPEGTPVVVAQARSRA
ncbi:nickel-dependent hydrogenase large subunit [Geomonas sp. RF6]|uniref:nickel-dependent hydrogenase large subunit n=1 Tax=Geomonas sp. RF6 TaxID=2897342 RepID=UPI001E5FE42D|nr:nickel-dependent hydrogenase large subunit [Geomonas sp. RF6]UFS71885.1 nickel-dependent hydrogenase large subunit [Geomonas sp. RF6]